MSNNIRELIKIDNNVNEGLGILKKNYLYNPYYTESEYMVMMMKLNEIINKELGKPLIETKWII